MRRLRGRAGCSKHIIMGAVADALDWRPCSRSPSSMNHPGANSGCSPRSPACARMLAGLTRAAGTIPTMVDGVVRTCSVKDAAAIPAPGILSFHVKHSGGELDSLHAEQQNTHGADRPAAAALALQRPLVGQT